MESLAAWWSAAADLVVGADCAGCGAPGLDWCGTCARSTRPTPRLIDDRSADLTVAAATENHGALARVLVAWKDRGRHRLTPALGHLLACSVLAVTADGDDVALVPVPTSRAQVRRRGHDPVLDLTVAAAETLASVGVRAQTMALLRRTRPTRDQVGLSLTERHANVAGAFAVSTDGLARLVRSGADRLVVVDDIWTTGSSAREAVRALRRGGARADTVAVVAATPASRGHETVPR